MALGCYGETGSLNVGMDFAFVVTACIFIFLELFKGEVESVAADGNNSTSMSRPLSAS